MKNLERRHNALGEGVGGGGGEYQLSVGVVFTIASCSILTPASSINNTRFRCKNCMISCFVFLGGVIYARLGNARAWDFLEEDVFPKIPHPLCSNFYASSSLSLSRFKLYESRIYYKLHFMYMMYNLQLLFEVIK